MFYNLAFPVSVFASPCYLNCCGGWKESFKACLLILEPNLDGRKNGGFLVFLFCQNNDNNNNNNNNNSKREEKT